VRRMHWKSGVETGVGRMYWKSERRVEGADGCEAKVVMLKQIENYSMESSCMCMVKDKE
jgi:hypothetical protein